MNDGTPPDKLDVVAVREVLAASKYQPRFRPVRLDRYKMAGGVPYYVKGLISRDSLIVVWGPPKVGKSFWTFDLAAHIAMGEPYRGRKVKKGAVVYIACEGEHGIAARCEAFKLDKLAEAIDDVRLYVSATRLSLPADAEQLAYDINLAVNPVTGCTPDEDGFLPVSCLVIDTLNRSIFGSESIDKDMGDYIRALDYLRDRFKCSIIVVHHCGIDGTRPRGHTSLTAAADVQIAVSRDDAGLVVSEVELAKDFEAGSRIFSRLRPVEVGTDDDGEPIVSMVVDEAEPSAAKPRGPKLSGDAAQALRLLKEAIATGGQTPPSSNHIPGNVMATTVDAWRGYFESGRANGSQSKDAKRKAFARAVARLQDSGHIGTWQDWVWAAGQVG